MPFTWVAFGKLKDFSARRGVIGRSIAALKCYLAIAADRDYRSGETILSTRDLAIVCGLSRPMVMEGTALLEHEGLLTIDRRAELNTHVYRLASTETGFRKVPQDAMFEKLRTIGSRGEITLAALKLYLTMLYHRDAEDNNASIAHRTIIDYTGIRPEQVTPAYSLLHNAGLVVVYRARPTNANGWETNVYRLLGDFGGTVNRRLRPTEYKRRLRRKTLTAPWEPDHDHNQGQIPGEEREHVF